MARAIWSGSISFGMVSIPVKLYGATESKDIRFHLLHAKDGTRLKQIRWCPTDEAEVPWNETARGYEYGKGQYVVLTDEDFEKSYYLEPGERAQKPYALLLRALEEKSLTAIATVTMRNKEQLCAIRAKGGVILLETLYYPDEVRKNIEADLDGVKVSDKELDMAYTLIELLHKPFDPSEYHDHYREAL